MNEMANAELWLWGIITVVFTVVMQLFPTEWRYRSPYAVSSWGWRLLCGEMAIAGSLRVGLTLATALWWCGAAGVLVSDVTRAALVLFFGGILLASLVNAGRRARLSVLGCLWFSGAVSAGVVMLVLVAMWLWQIFTRGQGVHG